MSQSNEEAWLSGPWRLTPENPLIAWHVIPYVNGAFELDYTSTRVVPPGATLTMKKVPEMCVFGFHFAPTPEGALAWKEKPYFPPGHPPREKVKHYLTKVEVWGNVKGGIVYYDLSTKGVANNRRIVGYITEEEMFRILANTARSWLTPILQKIIRESYDKTAEDYGYSETMWKLVQMAQDNIYRDLRGHPDVTSITETIGFVDKVCELLVEGENYDRLTLLLVGLKVIQQAEYPRVNMWDTCYMTFVRMLRLLATVIGIDETLEHRRKFHAFIESRLTPVEKSDEIIQEVLK